MLKKILLFSVFLITLIILTPKNTAFATALNDNSIDDEIEVKIEELLNGLDLTQIEKLFYDYKISSSDFMSFLLVIMKGEAGDYNQIFNTLLTLLKNNFSDYLPFFVSIITVVIFCGALSALQPEKQKTSTIVFSVCYGAVALILFSQTTGIISHTQEVIINIEKQTQSVFPILITLLTASGASASAAAYKPVCAFISGGIIKVILNLLLPIISLTLIISIVCTLSDKFTLKKMRDFFSSSFKWIIGSMLSVFSLFTTVKGITASNYDGISIRAVKYAVGNSFPIIGGFAKEGVDLILASSHLIKNAVGATALFILFFALVSPLISLAVYSLVLKFLNAIVEPFADSRICELISSFSKVITMLCSVIMVVFIIYFLTILLILSTHSSALI